MPLFKMHGTQRGMIKRKKTELVQETSEHLLSPQSNFFVREAYKTLRTNISFALTGEDKCKIVVVTSSVQGEGKSTTSLNLAISYAMTDRKVLVIDCDLRRPKLARLLKINSKVGLSNLIMDPSLLDKAILHTQLEGVDVILSGNIPPNPSELLGSVRMERLLETLKQTYDYIFLDSPPVNMVTDAVVLAPKSDGVLLVVRSNYSDRGSVIHAVEQLEYAKAKILGFVLNCLELERTRFAYGKYRYSMNSGYGSLGRGYRYGYSSSIPNPYAMDADLTEHGEQDS